MTINKLKLKVIIEITKHCAIMPYMVSCTKFLSFLTEFKRTIFLYLDFYTV